MTTARKTKKAPAEKEQSIELSHILAGKPLPFKNIFLAEGADSYAFSLVEKAVEKQFSGDDLSGMNKTRILCDSSTKASGVAAICDEYPFGAPYKLIVLENCQKLSSKEGQAFGNYLQNPSPASIVLIFENAEDIKANPGRFVPSRTFKSALKNYGLHIRCQLKPLQLKEWIVKAMAGEKKKISPHLADLLIETVGSDMRDLYQEMVKLALYAGKREQIKEEDIRAVSSLHDQSKIFNFTEQVGSRNAGEALLVLEELLKDKNSQFTIMTVLNNHFTFLCQLSGLADQGLDSDEMARKIRRHPFYVKKSLYQARKFTAEAYEKIFDLLARADGGIKQGMDPRLVSELTVLQICRMK